MKNLIFLPVRLNSKRLPKKNIKLLNGRSMFLYVLEEAIKSGLGDVYVSTDDRNFASELRRVQSEGFLISDYAKDYTTPFGVELRSNEYRKYEKKIDDVLYGFMEGTAWKYKNIIVLQVDCPFTIADDIKCAYQLYEETGFAVQSVTKLENGKGLTSSVFVSGDHDGGKIKPVYPATEDRSEMMSRDFPSTYLVNGAISIIHADEFKDAGTRHTVNSRAYIMPAERSFDIDTELDFKVAEYLMQRRGK